MWPRAKTNIVSCICAVFALCIYPQWQMNRVQMRVAMYVRSESGQFLRALMTNHNLYNSTGALQNMKRRLRGWVQGGMHHWRSGLEAWRVGGFLPPAQSPHMNGSASTRGWCTRRRTSVDTSKNMKHLGRVVMWSHPPMQSGTWADSAGMQPGITIKWGATSITLKVLMPGQLHQHMWGGNGGLGLYRWGRSK